LQVCNNRSNTLFQHYPFHWMKFKWIPQLHEFQPIREEVLKRVLEFKSFQIFSKLEQPLAMK
jgi:hypothetical protein